LQPECSKMYVIACKFSKILNFYRTALNAGRPSQEKAVRLSVKHVDCNKTVTG